MAVEELLCVPGCIPSGMVAYPLRTFRRDWLRFRFRPWVQSGGLPVIFATATLMKRAIIVHHEH
jgi:hypothetical protein